MPNRWQIASSHLTNNTQVHPRVWRPRSHEVLARPPKPPASVAHRDTIGHQPLTPESRSPVKEWKDHSLSASRIAGIHRSSKHTPYDCPHHRALCHNSRCGKSPSSVRSSRITAARQIHCETADGPIQTFSVLWTQFPRTIPRNDAVVWSVGLRLTRAHRWIYSCNGLSGSGGAVPTGRTQIQRALR
jgi:hypothetical protein